MESELKLLLDPTDVQALRRHSLVKAAALAEPKTLQLKSIYFDTSECLLRQYDLGLRVRRGNRIWIQTLKAGNSMAVAGLHQRGEWECRVRGPKPDFARLRKLIGGTQWATILASPQLSDSLAPVFVVEVERTTWQLQLPCGAHVELALDLGEIVREPMREPICEIELELQSGRPSALFDFALELQKSIPLRIGRYSKAERGYRLCNPQTMAATRAKRIVLDRDISVENGFQSIVTSCVEQIAANEDGVMHGADPESVHQLRVGLRRMRSALQLFKHIAPLPRGLADDFAWLCRKVADARDWEVFALDTLPSLAIAALASSAVAQLLQIAVTMASEKRKVAAKAIASARYARFTLTLAAWVESGRWRERLKTPDRGRLSEPLIQQATKLLGRRHRKLLKCGRRMQGGTPRERHRIRIAAKKLRYATEFLEALLPTELGKAYVKGLSALQDAQGHDNDAAVARVLLEELARKHPELVAAAKALRQYLSSQSKERRQTVHHAWELFLASPPPFARDRLASDRAA
ncbi:CHAD domain-containing protein [Cupriavidus sp. TMH.W2]|uniref:CYTH and CHAD domain-containing protein n=1 Tax=Cupriavidus sp. TMH.W2 TaxID=3434465 RepID=UPI003D76D2B8